MGALLHRSNAARLAAWPFAKFLEMAAELETVERSLRLRCVMVETDAFLDVCEVFFGPGGGRAFGRVEV